MIAVQIGQHSSEIVSGFQEAMTQVPAVVAVYYMAGSTDFLLHVAVRDADHLRDLAGDTITGRPEVSHVETSLIFEHRSRPTLPCYFEQ